MMKEWLVLGPLRTNSRTQINYQIMEIGFWSLQILTREPLAIGSDTTIDTVDGPIIFRVAKRINGPYPNTYSTELKSHIETPSLTVNEFNITAHQLAVHTNQIRWKRLLPQDPLIIRTKTTTTEYFDCLSLSRTGLLARYAAPLQTPHVGQHLQMQLSLPSGYHRIQGNIAYVQENSNSTDLGIKFAFPVIEERTNWDRYIQDWEKNNENLSGLDRI